MTQAIIRLVTQQKLFNIFFFFKYAYNIVFIQYIYIYLCYVGYQHQG